MRKEVIYAAALGGCIGAVLTSLFSLFSPLNAEDTAPDATFNTITCKHLSVIKDDGAPAVSLAGGASNHGSLVVHGDDKKYSVTINGGFRYTFENGSTGIIGGNIQVSAEKDFIYIGGPIGIVVEAKPTGFNDVVAIHGIHGGIFLNNPLPDRARTIYIGDRYGGGIIVEDGKGMTTPGMYGRVNITSGNGGQIELFGPSTDKQSSYQITIPSP